MGWAGHVAPTGNTRVVQGLVGRREGKSPLGRAGRRPDVSIIMVLTETASEGVGWIDPAQDTQTSSGLLLVR
jgi:hypothetical protein